MHACPLFHDCYSRPLLPQTYVIGLNAGYAAGVQAAHKDTALGRAAPIIQPSGEPGAERGPNAHL